MLTELVKAVFLIVYEMNEYLIHYLFLWISGWEILKLADNIIRRINKRYNLISAKLNNKYFIPKSKTKEEIFYWYIGTKWFRKCLFRRFLFKLRENRRKRIFQDHSASILMRNLKQTIKFKQLETRTVLMKFTMHKYINWEKKLTKYKENRSIVFVECKYFPELNIKENIFEIYNKNLNL